MEHAAKDSHDSSIEVLTFSGLRIVWVECFFLTLPRVSPCLLVAILVREEQRGGPRLGEPLSNNDFRSFRFGEAHS